MPTFIIIFALLFTGCSKNDEFEDIITKLKQIKTTTTIVQQDQSKPKAAKKDKANFKKEDIKKESTKTATAKIKIKEEEKKDEKIAYKNKDEKKLPKITNLTLKTLSNKKIKIDLKGEKTIFEPYKGKIILIDFFTTWCTNCIISITHYNKLQKEFKKDLQIIAISLDEGKRYSEMLQFKQKYKINYPITFGEENFEFAKVWGNINVFPTIIILDKDGNYYTHYNGAPPLEMLQKDIKTLLTKQKGKK